ncbi:hypothetical protein ACFQH1_11810 [Lactiplantibacillus daoliensis]|uniref:Lipoprotein n=1 Tax=Lactiplantibacillus daoliensis TaxID=2559916 RepID=A0ABW1UID9_9LACO|nr:hypothetical protein [Lactiplantibacillus daoliensis]
MRKIWGFFGLALLSLGLAGCQSAVTGNDTADRQISSAAPTVTAVSKVHSTDYLGRWVNQTEHLALYLNTNQQLALFQTGHTTISGHFNLKLAKSNQATLTQSTLGSTTLALTNATSMTFQHGAQTIKLTKDTGWSPEHGDMPTTTQAALKGTSLINETPLKSNY